MTAHALGRSLRGRWLAFAATIAAALMLSALVVVGALLGVRSEPRGELTTGTGVPADYLALYFNAAERFHLGPDGWSLLAAVGKIECDHGRSSLPGCHPGERNSAGARGPAQFLPATWAIYGIDGDGDGDRDVYDSADAIGGMANYLRASGAPEDWRRALFAYNRANWYVEQVLRQAAEYRASALDTSPLEVAAPPAGNSWLAPLPGFPGERCDARIVKDVMLLVRSFGISVTDCFGGAPHDVDGEHPLGLAIDAVPVGGDWQRIAIMARHFGWREACAATGCPGAGPFRVVLYNGYPGHGDPRHARRPHIHLSWQHGPAAPYTPAPWVRAIFPTAAVAALLVNKRARSCARGGPVGCIRMA